MITIKSKLGIHARPASLIVAEAKNYNCEIFIIKDGNEYNAKSIINIMSMEAKFGDQLELKTVGEDADEALEKMTAFMQEL